MTSSASAHSEATAWTRQAVAILRKDLTAEFRNRAAINSILLFAVTALVVVGFAVGAGAELTTGIKSALLWVVLFYAAFSGLAHVFLHEEERSTSLALRLSAAPGAVYAGKLLFNLLLLMTIAVVVVPLYALILGLQLPHPLEFMAILLSGCLGLGAAATIVAAVIAKARGKGALYGALGFPVTLPLLMIAVNATKNTMELEIYRGVFFRDLTGLLAFGVMLIIASAALFPFVWEDV